MENWQCFVPKRILFLRRGTCLIACWRQLPYDFQFHSLDFPVDVPMLILSQGKSITPADCVVPLSPTASALLSAAGVDSVAATRALDIPLARQYLCAVKGLPRSLSPEVSTAIEDDMVALRATTPITVAC